VAEVRRKSEPGCRQGLGLIVCQVSSDPVVAASLALEVDSSRVKILFTLSTFLAEHAYIRHLAQSTIIEAFLKRAMLLALSGFQSEVVPG